MKFIAALIAIFISCSCLAQQSDLIDLQKFDASHLINLYKTKCDSLRSSKKISSLQFDSILYKAALMHASFLVNNNGDGHFEKDTKVRTPFQRVEKLGGTDFISVGENQLTTYLLTPIVFFYEKKEVEHTITTYPEAAQHLFDMFYNSPLHYQNMINRNFTHEAISIIYSPDCNCIKMVDVFGEK